VWWFAFVERRVHVPALELRVSCFEVGFSDRVEVPGVAGVGFGVEFCDAVEVGRLVAFADETNVGGGGNADYLLFLWKECILDEILLGI
jgi:hypothetical protein